LRNKCLGIKSSLARRSQKQNATFLKPASAGFLFFRSSQFFPSNWSRARIGRRNRRPRVRLCPESWQGVNVDRLRSKWTRVVEISQIEKMWICLMQGTAHAIGGPLCQVFLQENLTRRREPVAPPQGQNCIFCVTKPPFRGGFVHLNIDMQTLD
jgi:hypothetical protein